MQLAMAKRVGADVSPSKVVALWDCFTEPMCFDSPKVEVKDPTGRAGDALNAIEGVQVTAIYS